eukprot:GAFH01002034.1.p5 GENE.GAFH01002034.1~~GAFH01002034.1.p5  ORF type:complete len:80 (+),score=4.42 GAFH01002034.1:832-1071(+)
MPAHPLDILGVPLQNRDALRIANHIPHPASTIATARGQHVAIRTPHRRLHLGIMAFEDLAKTDLHGSIGLGRNSDIEHN